MRKSSQFPMASAQATLEAPSNSQVGQLRSSEIKRAPFGDGLVRELGETLRCEIAPLVQVIGRKFSSRSAKYQAMRDVALAMIKEHQLWIWNINLEVLDVAHERIDTSEEGIARFLAWTAKIIERAALKRFEEIGSFDIARSSRRDATDIAMADGPMLSTPYMLENAKLLCGYFVHRYAHDSLPDWYSKKYQQPPILRAAEEYVEAHHGELIDGITDQLIADIQMRGQVITEEECASIRRAVRGDFILRESERLKATFGRIRQSFMQAKFAGGLPYRRTLQEV